MKKINNEKMYDLKMNYDVNNALSLISAYSTLVESDESKYMPLLKKSIKNTLIMLNNYRSQYDIMDLNYLLENVVNYYKPIFKYEKINLKYVKNDDEAFVLGDYNKLKHVLFNIINNARDSLKESVHATITISSRIVHNKIIIKICNNGQSIIYDTNKSNSFKIIKEHHGKLIYESVKGKYTKVYLKLDCINLV